MACFFVEHWSEFTMSKICWEPRQIYVTAGIVRKLRTSWYNEYKSSKERWCRCWILGMSENAGIPWSWMTSSRSTFPRETRQTRVSTAYTCVCLKNGKEHWRRSLHVCSTSARVENLVHRHVREHCYFLEPYLLSRVRCHLPENWGLRHSTFEVAIFRMQEASRKRILCL